MANEILTPQMITREAGRILHQKLNFTGNCNLQYDDRFAQTGAKIGQQLDVRLPAKYRTRRGATLSTQDHVERSTPLVVASQFGVDVNFSSVELTLDLDDFSQRVLEPAMSVLAADIEGEALAKAKNRIANFTNATTNQVMNYRNFRKNGAVLTKNLAPLSERCAVLYPDSTVEFGDATKGLFQDSTSIANQYREGILGRTGGFDVLENTLLPTHTNGAALGGTPVTNGAALGTSATTNVYVSQSTISIDGASGTPTITAGTIVTFGTVSAGIVAVHDETKQSQGFLQPFVVQEDVTLAAGAGDIVVKPGLVYGDGNAFQNCTISGGGDTDGLAVNVVGAADGSFQNDIFMHKDAFVFATADLDDVSQYGAFGARDVMDGISIRLARQYDINSDNVPARLDVLWGFDELYPELACRHMYNPAAVT